MGKFEHTKLIFSAKLEFYLKWSLVPLSVIGIKPSESKNENMSNSRNLFCMVAVWKFFRQFNSYLTCSICARKYVYNDNLESFTKKLWKRPFYFRSFVFILIQSLFPKSRQTTVHFRSDPNSTCSHPYKSHPLFIEISNFFECHNW